MSGGALWILKSVDAAEPAQPEADDGAPPAADHLGLLLALVMGSGCIGGAFGLLLTRSRPTDEAVLAELERAATRVAEGDLTSTINMRVGGKADQTFRSFDRMTRELREMRVRLAEAERVCCVPGDRTANRPRDQESPVAHSARHGDPAQGARQADCRVRRESSRSPRARSWRRCDAWSASCASSASSRACPSRNPELWRSPH